MSHDRYFAYGSNLSAAWLRDRVPSAAAKGVARAPGYGLRLDKRGADGSAKANLHRAPGATAWGVVYTLDPAHWPDLDACERYYARLEIDVWLGEEKTRVQTYHSDLLTEDTIPFAWYKRLIVEGAREHGLPEAWQMLLEALPSRPPEQGP